jgi:CRISPR/Cas system-associated protein endoribonuclease Cas2
MKLNKEANEFALSLLANHFELVSVFQKIYCIDRTIVYEANFITKNISGKSNELFELRINEEQFNKLKTLIGARNEVLKRCQN